MAKMFYQWKCECGLDFDTDHTHGSKTETRPHPSGRNFERKIPFAFCPECKKKVFFLKNIQFTP